MKTPRKCHDHEAQSKNIILSWIIIQSLSVYVTVFYFDKFACFKIMLISLTIKSAFYEALQGVLGNRGIMSFISGEQVNTSLKMKGTGEQR